MSLLLESIKLVDGSFCNLFFHEQRMNKSLHLLCGSVEHYNLEDLLSHIDYPQRGLYKCRIVYDETKTEIEFVPYHAKEITTLKVVESDRINYEYKFVDRKAIDRLYEQREGCDDILIIKKGFVTDTSYCNIVFRRGRTWYTPWSALLKGTQRQKLLEYNIIHEEDIRLEDIESFDSFKLINAMIEFDSPERDVSNIIFK